MFSQKNDNLWMRRSFVLLSAVALASTAFINLVPAQAHMAPINDGGNNNGGGGHRRHHRRHIHQPGLGPDVPEPRRFWPNNDPNGNNNGGHHPDDPNNNNHDPNKPSQNLGMNSHPPDGRHDWNGWNHDWDHRWVNNWSNSWNDSDVTFDVHRYRRYNDVTNNNNTNEVSVPTQQETWSASIIHPGKDIPNFHEVHPWLFRGGQPSEAGLQQLYDSGVRTVVNLRSDPREVESERQLCERYGLRYVSIPMSSNVGPTDQQIDQFMAVVDRAAERPDRGSVFVHCHLGADRTGCMVALYRELHDNYSFAKAHQEMLAYGFHEKYSKLKAAVSQNAATKTSTK